MKVNHTSTKSLYSFMDIVGRMGMQSIVGEDAALSKDITMGYNKVTEVIQIQDTKTLAYIIERFDGNRVYLIDYSGDLLLSLLYNIGSANKLRGDIVNVKINKEKNTKTGAEIRTTEVIDHHCIPLKNYCPTLENIQLYVDYLVAKDKSYKHMEYAMSHVLCYKAGLTKEQLASTRTKLNMVGKKCMLVDINTILFEDNGQTMIYTAQPQINTFYNIATSKPDFTIEAIKENNIQTIGNYRTIDIPESQYIKYIG